jgi:hypothetical protein
MSASTGEQAVIALTATLTHEQLCDLALVIAEEELKQGVVDNHELRSAIALGVLSGLGVKADKIERAKDFIRQQRDRPSLTVVGGIH